MKSLLLNQCKILAYVLAHLFASAAGAAPDAKRLGEILGYPADNLIVQDVTDEERNLWRMPSASERFNSAPLGDPDTLLAAYKITGRNPATFFPIKMWFGRGGAFLNPEIRQLFDRIATDPDRPVIQGGRGPFGSQSFNGLGEGGIYLGRIKVLFKNKEMEKPQDKTAIISVVHLPPEGVDVRIAIMAALEGGAELSPVAGGEKYYERFRPSKDGESRPRYDVAGLFRSLNRLASAELHTTAKPTQTSPEDLSWNDVETEDKETSVSKEYDRSEKIGSVNRVWLVTFAAIVIAILLYKRCRWLGDKESP
jgi:hypothetical protein